MLEPNKVVLGKDPGFRRVLNAARIVAATDATVLVLGESGTGKELLARDIHTHSHRAGRLFKVLNCAGAADGIFESDLDRYSRGISVDLARQATRNESRSPGTLFLKDVAELSSQAQSRLLRFLSSSAEGYAGGVGKAALRPRVIAATSRELGAEVQAGRFREDLFYRLQVVPLELPALRQRAGDTAVLLKHYVATFARHYRLPAPKFTTVALRSLRHYQWPGNIRELCNFCERMVILFSGNTVHPENLPEDIRRGRLASERRGRFILPEGGLSLPALEADMIKQALRMSSGNRSRAARLLGISRDTLLYRMHKHAITV